LKIISKRARAVKKDAGPVPGLEVTEIYESSIIIIDGSGQMSPADIKRAEEIFREIRRQLEGIGGILTP